MLLLAPVCMHEWCEFTGLHEHWLTCNIGLTCAPVNPYLHSKYMHGGPCQQHSKLSAWTTASFFTSSLSLRTIAACQTTNRFLTVEQKAACCCLNSHARC
jgi:hypothetical protein